MLVSPEISQGKLAKSNVEVVPDSTKVKPDSPLIVDVPVAVKTLLLALLDIEVVPLVPLDPEVPD